MQVYILKESNSDSRVAASPDTVKKMIDWGLKVFIHDNSGLNSNFSNEDYVKSGATISSSITDISKSDLILKINKPNDDEIALMNEGSILIASLDPYNNNETLNKLKDKGVTSFAMELMPRITRAQSMDILSSQSNLAGYKAVIDATYLFNKAMPMMMTAAGTIAPAKVMVFGAGVAGLQAIATAKRLGAIVSATDVRGSTLSVFNLLSFSINLKIEFKSSANFSAFCSSTDILDNFDICFIVLRSMLICYLNMTQTIT